MSNTGLIAGGAVVFIFGLLLTMGVFDWLIGLLGALAIIIGVVLFAIGAWSTARGR